MNGATEADLQVLVRDTIRRWRAGEPPDADALLKRHPSLSSYKGLAIDLIYEEYCLRHEQGDTLVPSTFCERFPHYEQSLSKMLAVHETLEGSAARLQDHSAARQDQTAPRPAPSSWPKAGETFMGYELIETLGRGSLARVFLAREAAVGRRFVVVKISRHGAGEAQLLGKAAHPGIVPILSVKHDDITGWTVICMPFLGTATGADLLEAAKAGGNAARSAALISQVAARFRPVGVAETVPPQEAIAWRGPYADGVARFGLLLAEGLQAAHAVGVMHRDIKPSNVLLAWSGRPMLLDFNLSAEIGLLSQRVGGTLAYMAPEWMEALATSERLPARQFDPRADLYSLGAVLYELLTGHLPAKPAGAEDLAPGDIEPWLVARREKLVPLREIDPQIDSQLEAIVLRCLARNPGGRYLSAGELAGALRRYLAWQPRGWRMLRRRRREVLAAAVGTAALAAGSGVYISRLPPLEERLFARAMREFDQGQYVAAEQTLGRCLAIRPDWSEARFARGQALRMTGDLGAARTEFLALKEHSVALAYALAGYCDLALDNHVAAENDYAVAIQAGASDPVTWANRGYCQKRHGQRRQAIVSLDKALAADPNLAVARCNRALTRFQDSLSSQQPISDETLADIRAACRLAPQRADFHFHAASILAVAMRSPPPESLRTQDSLRDEALAHLRQAYELGYPQQSLKGVEPGLRSLLGELPPELQIPETGPKRPAAPLYASPPETADLSGFIARNGTF